MSTLRVISPDIVREFAVYKQGLHQRRQSNDQDTLKAIIRQIGLLQLDSISVTARSHYLVMLARAGCYDRGDLDALLPERFLFEPWAHAACLIPMADYGFFAPRIHSRKREQYAGWFKRMGDDPDALLHYVQDEIRARGPLTSSDFDTPRPGQGGWWNLKPAKYALEFLFDTGELMVNHREHFRRYYELADRVLDDADYESGHTVDDYQHWAALRGLRHIGVGTVKHIADYYRLKRARTEQEIAAWVEAGAVEAVEVPGWQEPAYIETGDLAQVESIENGEHRPELTVFLSPFDNLIWHRERTETVFNFHYRIEVYTPKEKRKYGYYVLPILHRGRLVGRIDPKIDRKKKQLLIHALHLEPGVTVDDTLLDGLSGAIGEFMQFHHCETVSINRSDDAPDLKAALQENLPTD